MFLFFLRYVRVFRRWRGRREVFLVFFFRDFVFLRVGFVVELFRREFDIRFWVSRGVVGKRFWYFRFGLVFLGAGNRESDFVGCGDFIEGLREGCGETEFFRLFRFWYGRVFRM